ncbi:MAG TPA: hypothetical protein VMF32_26365, partial [Xanthobacteraceae bacterium]|nr:hypothetical protein [Xanthobacteraceae bacterium]
MLLLAKIGHNTAARRFFLIALPEKICYNTSDAETATVYTIPTVKRSPVGLSCLRACASSARGKRRHR